MTLKYLKDGSKGIEYLDFLDNLWWELDNSR